MDDEFAAIVATIAAAIGEPDLPVQAYRLSEKENSARARVVFVPTDFEPRAPIETGPRIGSDGTMYDAIWRETWTVECMIWGESWTAAERLRRRLMVVIKQLFRTSVRFSGGSWLTQAAPEARHMWGGAEAIRMRMLWDLDVYAEPAPQVVLDGFETDVSAREVPDPTQTITFSQP